MEIRVMSYNIQAGLGMDGVRDVGRAAEVILQQNADIVGLQEVERGGMRSLMENQPARIARLTGFHQAFGYGFQRGPWRFGNCILSRFPIRSFERRPLSSSGEQRAVTVATVDLAGGNLLNVLCTHLGLNGEERVRQARDLKAVVAGLSGPVILMGDFNERPGSPALSELLNGSGLVDVTSSASTFPAPAPEAKIDFIFAREMPPVSSTSVVSTLVSDHLPVTATFELP